MKGIVCEKFGPPEVLKLKEIEKPVPKDNEILIRNYASSINKSDMMFRNAKLESAIFWTLRTLLRPLIRFEVGIRKPKRKIPGGDFAGEIVSVGKDVTEWKEGDKVYGYSDAGGALAEFLCLPASYRKLTKMPSNMGFQEAGTVPGGAPPALTGLRDLGNLQKGQKILIIGASSGIGTFAVQIAKVYGAEVTGVCGPTNLDMVMELGADYVIDYTKEDYIKNGKKYDVVFDVVVVNTFSRCKKILSENGYYVSNNPLNSKKHLFYMITGRNKQFKQGSTDESAENLSILRDWIEQGKVKPIIDKVFPLDQAAEAHRYYETGHANGRVVISIGDD
ncbi:MAG: NAD(P)-dependent alcohol dehydrogenase [Candidatus Hodarchaeales archaeon]|jgi:NADPH:quinone reductase-like Zn-dependent oxidoreductase